MMVYMDADTFELCDRIILIDFDGNDVCDELPYKDFYYEMHNPSYLY
ncbi:MAG: hypothetical protein IJ086_15755 [Clostridium sp.]|nr:hypothetical protein [Clostridium sp.]MBQ9000129.1 hypothetical protein [Clostridium sp.]